MEPIGNLFGDSSPRESVRKPVRRRSERGDLLVFFLARLNQERAGKFPPLPMRRLAVQLSHLSLHDLYFLKSVCTDAERRGGSFSATFWYELKPR